MKEALNRPDTGVKPPTPIIKIGLESARGQNRQSLDRGALSVSQLQQPYIMSISTNESAKHRQPLPQMRFPGTQANKNIKNVFSN